MVLLFYNVEKLIAGSYSGNICETDYKLFDVSYSLASLNKLYDNIRICIAIYEYTYYMFTNDRYLFV